MQKGDHGETERATDPGGALTHDDVSRLLEILERSDFDYLEIEVEGTRLVAGKAGWQAFARPVAPVTSAEVEQTQTAEPPSSPAKQTHEPDHVPVTAPIVGVFYRAPEPGATPYVELGSIVEVDQTLGLIEVMKMFNGVTAAEAGEVVDILVEDGDFVEFGQPLMMLRPVAG